MMIYLSDETAAKLRATAKANHRSPNKQVAAFLDGAK